MEHFFKFACAPPLPLPPPEPPLPPTTHINPSACFQFYKILHKFDPPPPHPLPPNHSHQHLCMLQMLQDVTQVRSRTPSPPPAKPNPAPTPSQPPPPKLLFVSFVPFETSCLIRIPPARFPAAPPSIPISMSAPPLSCTFTPK